MTLVEQRKVAKRKAAVYDQKLRATDPRFSHCVKATLHDGSSFFIDSSFVVSDGVWYWVFSEHQNFSVFHTEDVAQIAMYGGRLPIKDGP